MQQLPVRERREIVVRGIVQGVGFRPFIYSLAHRHGLAGWVRNDVAGVHIEVEGAPETLELFLIGITEEAPPLAVVESVTWQSLTAHGEQEFRIEASLEGERHQALVPPDVATCEQCLWELFDPQDRRYRYPFINCTNCGPRFTITRTVPYDRPMTTMAGFTMCPECRREYDDPTDRRFHAQPNACPACGPQVRLLDRSGSETVGLQVFRCSGIQAYQSKIENRKSKIQQDVIARAARLLCAGAIVAVKGLGGYHLACDPFDPEAVRRLRECKIRQDKPFALMARNLEQVRTLCRVGPEEETLLTSPARPIVLLERRTDSEVAEAVAPRQKTLGVMLAYTPLHYLLLHEIGAPLVLTSGNRSDEPIAYRDEEALAQLADIADYFLVHNRPIHMRCDDSVVRFTSIRRGRRGEEEKGNRGIYFIRRSRGYAPAPLSMAENFAQPILACGGELKNTFCLAKERHAFLSHYIGDLENYETLCSFRQGIEHFCRLFDVQPELIAYDLHPEYFSTKYARELEEAGLTGVGVQHHHAHIASCLADNERPSTERVVGVALDGTGYGTDGAIWGGEFLEGSLQEGFIRRAHLEYVPLPGGEAAIRQPWRIAIAHLISLYGEDRVLQLPLMPVQWAGERNVRHIVQLMEHRLNTPLTSSAGRLFDAVAALIGAPGTQQITYEGQAAVELELVASDPAAQGYPFRLQLEGEMWIVETGEIITGVVEDLLARQPAGDIASRFHRTMAEIVAAACLQIREETGVGAVALSGGAFQNVLLLHQVIELLGDNGFVIYRHKRVPTNDGGLSLGQAAIANSRLERVRFEI